VVVQAGAVTVTAEEVGAAGCVIGVVDRTGELEIERTGVDCVMARACVGVPLNRGTRSTSLATASTPLRPRSKARSFWGGDPMLKLSL
jgi:hypothetical protein